MALPNELLFELKDLLALPDGLKLCLLCDFSLEKRHIVWKDALIELTDYLSNCVLTEVSVKWMLVLSQTHQVESITIKKGDKFESIVVPDGVSEVKIPDSVIKVNCRAHKIEMFRGCMVKYTSSKFYAGSLFYKIIRGSTMDPLTLYLYSKEYDKLVTWVFPPEVPPNIKYLYFMRKDFPTYHHREKDLLIKNHPRNYKQLIELIWPLNTEELIEVLKHCPKLTVVGYINPNDALLIKQRGIEGILFKQIE